MPVSDGDYRQRLAKTLRERYAGGREAAFAKTKNIPEMKSPERSLIPMPPLDRWAERQAEEENRRRLVAMTDRNMRLMVSSGNMPEFMPPVAGIGNLSARIATPILQRAIQAANAEGKYVASDIIEQAAGKGARYSQDLIPKAGRAAEDELFAFLKELERLGVKPATANRFLKGFAQYADDPFEAMSTLGQKMDISPTAGMPAKEALIQRLLGKLGKAAEDTFFGG